MGSMTLAEFRTDLTLALEGRADVALTDAVKNRWINFTYRHLTRPGVRMFEEVKYRYDFSLVTAQNEYILSLANVGRRVLGIADVTYYANSTITEASTTIRRDLDPVSLQKMNGMSKPDAQPSLYAETGNAGNRILILNTRPSSTENGHQVRMSYYSQVDKMADDTDVTVLEDYWDLAILAGSIFFTKWFLGYKEEAVADGQLYQQLINEADSDLELGAEDTGRRTEVKHGPHMEMDSGI